MLNKIITDSENDLTEQLSKLIEKVSNDCIKEKNSFYIGLSGGSVVKFLTIGLPKINTDFSKWILVFCDERVVPESNPDSTFGIYKKDLLPNIPLKENQFIKIKQGLSAEDAAKDYVNQLKSLFPSEELPSFDMLLLGMGPDGHTCSLFPNHKLLTESNVWIAPIVDSPKPPSCRITMTFPVLNNAKFCVFATAGEGKADMIKRILKDKEDLPAGKVNPKNGELYWIIDKAAAKNL